MNLNGEKDVLNAAKWEGRLRTVIEHGTELFQT